jgi:hypothetical protein
MYPVRERFTPLQRPSVNPTGEEMSQELEQHQCPDHEPDRSEKGEEQDHEKQADEGVGRYLVIEYRVFHRMNSQYSLVKA